MVKFIYFRHVSLYINDVVGGQFVLDYLFFVLWKCPRRRREGCQGSGTGYKKHLYPPQEQGRANV